MRFAFVALALLLSTNSFARGHAASVGDEYSALERQRQSYEERQAAAQAVSDTASKRAMLLDLFQREQGVQATTGLKNGGEYLGRDAVYFRINNGMLCKMIYSDNWELGSDSSRGSCSIGTRGWVDCTSSTASIHWTGAILSEEVPSYALACRSGPHGRLR